MFKNIVLACLIAGSMTYTASAQTASMKEEMDIYEKIYDAPLQLTGKGPQELHSVYSKKPLLVALIFTRCTGVCYPFLLQLEENLQLLENNSFNVLVLSFDPRDSLEDMELLSQRMNLADNSQWLFGTTTHIDELLQSVSFYPKWDSTKQQFDHDALLIGVNNEGYITKKLLGIRGGHDLDLLVASVNNIFSPTYRIPDKNALFSCFNYDPTTGKSTPGLGLLFVALPSVIGVFLLVFIRFTVRNYSVV